MRGLTLRDPAFLGGLSKPGDVISNLDPPFDFDFSDESTVAVFDNKITEITSKGTSSWKLTKSSTGPGYITGINGKKCCDWGSPGHNNHLRNTSTIPVNVAEWYIVLDANFESAFSSFNGLITSPFDSVDPSTLRWFVTGRLNTNAFWPFGAQYDAVYLNGSSTNVFADGVLPTINNPCLLRAKKVDDTPVTLLDGLQIGNDRNIPDRGWGGLVGRVIGFSSPLSMTNREAVQNKLATDWNLTLA